jgi:alpha-1,6-mannosyltransferase
MRAAATTTGAPIGLDAGDAERRRARRRSREPAAPSRARAARALGVLGLFAIVASVFLIAAAAASEPTQYVPARSGGWPPWLAGPFAGLHLSGLSAGGFQALTLALCAGYVLVLLCARALSLRALWVAIVLAHVILLLGPPLLSQDVFGYIGFARLGALHGLDPYTHVAAQASSDEVFAFVGWPYQHSPYGPLFTLLSYAFVPLGVGGALWAFKALAVVSSLAAIALVGRAARMLGGSRRWAIAFVGCNPVLLVLAVGGAHNDTLIMLALAGALVLSAGVRQHLRAPSRARAGAAALVAGVGVKLTAGLALPFLVLAPKRTDERTRVALAAAASLVVLGAIGLIGFGGHTLGFLGAVGEQQQLVAVHSIPDETARLLALSGTPRWWRDVFVVGFAIAFAFALWRTARGGDWRVAAGWTTLALLVSTAWLLPWYAIWTLPLAAVCRDRRLRAATLVFCAYAVLIHLPLAEGLLTPPRVKGVHVRPYPRRHSVDLSRLQVTNDALLDLGR